MAAPAGGSASAHDRRGICQRLIAERRVVGRQLGFALCPAPKWDMLLDIYLATVEARSLYLSALCAAAHVPESTAHRHVAELVAAGLLERAADNGDARRIRIRLSQRGAAVMAALIDQIATLDRRSG